MRRIIIVVCLVASGAGVSSTASAASAPRGAIVLKASAIKKAGSTQCGKVKGVWISGKVTKIKSKNYFVSHSKSSQFYSADARKARGANKKKLQKLSSDFKKKSSLGGKRCSRFNVPVPMVTTVPDSTTITTIVAPGPQSLKFDVSNAVALVLSDSSVSSASVRKKALGSNLQIIDIAGKTKDAVVSGQASIKRYLIAPNDKLYVEFSDAPNIDGAPCLLAEVSKATGLPSCIEPDVEFLIVSPGQRGGFSFCPGTCGSMRKSLINDIQFDDRGAVYYMGVPSIKSEFPNALGIDDVFGFGWADSERPGKLKASVGTVVRRFFNGVRTDFGLGSLYLGTEDEPGFSPGSQTNKVMLGNPITNFVVFGDGTLLIDQLLSTRPMSKVITPSNCELHRLDRWSSSGVRQSVSGIVPWIEKAKISGGDCSNFLVNSMGQDPDVFLLSTFSLIKIDSKTVVAIGRPSFEWQQIGPLLTTHMFRIEAPFVDADEVTYVSEPPSLGRSRIWNPETKCSGGLDIKKRDYLSYICQNGSAMIRGSWRTPSGDWFAVIGQDRHWNLRGGLANTPGALNDKEDLSGVDFGSGVLVRLLPHLQPTVLGFPEQSTDLVRIETYLPILDSVVASGKDANGQTRTFLYNTKSRTSQQLLSPTDGVRPTHFVFNASKNRLLVVGIAPNDDRIVGFIDLASGRYVVTTRTKSSILDVKAFDS
jgi:hypothetical protein